MSEPTTDDPRTSHAPRSFLVTGGAGFIGSHLADALLERGDHVVALDDLSTGRLRNLDAASQHSTFRFVQGSVLDELIVDELVHECDFVVHLAAAVGVRLIVERPLRSFTTNIRGSEVVIEAAYRHRRPIMVTSTSEVYGKNDSGALTETSDRILGSPAVARWAYSVAKSVDEILALAYHRERGLPVRIVRLFNTVGPRQSAAYGMVVPRLVGQALDGQPLTVYGDGQQSRCFCHVRDVIAALTAIIDEPRADGEVYNVGSNEEVTIHDLAKRITTLTSSRSSVELMPYDIAYERGFEDMRRRVPDTSKLHDLVGWRASRTLDDILRDTIAGVRADKLAAEALADS